MLYYYVTKNILSGDYNGSESIDYYTFGILVNIPQSIRINYCMHDALRSNINIPIAYH